MESGCSQSPAVATFFGLKPIECLTNASRLSAVKKKKKTMEISSPSNAIFDETATGPATIVSRRPHGHRPSSRRPQARGMTATGPAIMEVDPGSVAGTAVDRFLDEPLARGLNGETAVDRFLDEPSDRGPAGETAVDRSLDTGVGLKASAKKDEVSLPQTGPFFAGMKKAAEQQAIPLLIDLMSARGSAKKNKAVGSDGCPSEFWKYLSCVSMVVIFRLFLMRLLAMEDGRNVDSPH